MCVPDGHLIERGTLFDRIARIACQSVGATIAFVTLRHEKKLYILGAHGLHWTNFATSWAIDAQLVRPEGMSHVRNVRQEPALKGHPLLSAAPFVKSMTHVPAPNQSDGLEAALTLFDPTMKWPFNAATTGILNDLAMLVGDSVRAGVAVDDLFEKPPRKSGAKAAVGLSEAPAKFVEPTNLANNTAGKFLLTTLARRPSIRSRKDVSYMTLRTWSAAIKSHQLEALQILKAEPDPNVVRPIADEFVQHIRKLYGEGHFVQVVPVPCGHSKREDCLSVLIAEQIAREFKISCVRALQSTPRKGRSHPSKNATLDPPKLTTTQRLDNVLLIDDVVSSGRHIELAVQQLRPVCDHISVIGWIGPR